MQSDSILAAAFTGLALAAAIGWSPHADASVTRCVGPDGRVSYQDSSCPNGARGAPVDTTPNQGFQFATKDQIQRAKRLSAERELPEFRAPRGGKAKAKVKEAVNAGERRFLQTGITADEVRQRIGAPDRIAHSSTGKLRSKDARQQWIYTPATEDPQTTTVLTVRKGVVTQIERRVTY